MIITAKKGYDTAHRPASINAVLIKGLFFHSERCKYTSPCFFMCGHIAFLVVVVLLQGLRKEGWNEGKQL